MKAIRAVLAIGAILLVILIAVFLLWPSPPPRVVDRLCVFIRNELKMDCVAIVASDSYVKPGAIVAYSPPPDGGGGVPLPIGDLSSSACRVPGLPGAGMWTGVDKSQPISMPQLTYDTNRKLETGADVNVIARLTDDCQQRIAKFLQKN